MVFLSNNPTRDPQMYVDKLTALGIPAALDEILNTVVTMTAWLLEHAADKKIFVIGEAAAEVGADRRGTDVDRGRPRGGHRRRQLRPDVRVPETADRLRRHRGAIAGRSW